MQNIYLFSEFGSKYQVSRDVTEIKLCINYTNEKKKKKKAKKEKRKKKKNKGRIEKVQGSGFHNCLGVVWLGESRAL